jgi:hypothetical protein
MEHGQTDSTCSTLSIAIRGRSRLNTLPTHHVSDVWSRQYLATHLHARTSLLTQNQRRMMKKVQRLAVLAAATACLVTIGSGTANAALTTQHQSAGALVFAQTDDPTGNAVVVYERSSTGALKETKSYPTGGLGGILGGSVVDHTASEGSMAYSDNTLLVANAGSNSVTSFAIVGTRLVRRQVVSSEGDFPVSVAVHGQFVYVLNARDGGAVQGFIDVAGFLTKLPNSHRDLKLDPSATPEFTSTPAETAFTPDGSKLLVSTKGDSSAFDVFANRGLFGLSAIPVVTTIAGAVPFGFTFDRSGNVVTTEAGLNAVAIFSIARGGTLTQISQALTGQQATCWIVRDGANFYASNAGSGTLSGYADDKDGELSVAGVTSTDPGTVDAAVTGDGKFLYAQTGATGTIDEFKVGPKGTLTKIGTVTLPGGVGAEGIVAL